MLGAEHVLVPTAHVPGPIGFPHRLGDVTGNWIIRMVLGMAHVITAVLQAVDEVIDAGIHVVSPAGGRVAPVQIGNAVQIIAFHVVDDTEGAREARGIILHATGRVPVGRRVIGLRPSHCRAKERSGADAKRLHGRPHWVPGNSRVSTWNLHRVKSTVSNVRIWRAVVDCRIQSPYYIPSPPALPVQRRSSRSCVTSRRRPACQTLSGCLGWSKGR